MPITPHSRLSAQERARLFRARWKALRHELAAAGTDAEEWLRLLRPAVSLSVRRYPSDAAHRWLDGIRCEVDAGSSARLDGDATSTASRR